MKKEKKPMVDVNKPSSVRKVMTLPKDVAATIEDYAIFLSEKNGQKIKAGDVVGIRCRDLANCPLYREWKANRASKPRTIPARQEGAAKSAQGDGT